MTIILKVSTLRPVRRQRVWTAQYSLAPPPHAASFGYCSKMVSQIEFISLKDFNKIADIMQCGVSTQ